MLIATHFDENDEAVSQWVASAVQKTPQGRVEILAQCLTRHGDVSVNSPQVVATITAGHVTTITESGVFVGKWDADDHMVAAA